MTGVRDDTDLCDALDVLTVIRIDMTKETHDALGKWRQIIDRADIAAKARAGKLDRSQWGLQPHQVEQQKAALRTLGQTER
jgi:hypothetical protein